MDLSLIISVIGGLVGGNAIGMISKGLSMGGLGNTIAGAIGGGGAGAVLSGLTGGAVDASVATDAAATAGSMDIMGMVKTAGLGAVGGGALTGVGGILKGLMGR